MTRPSPADASPDAGFAPLSADFAADPYPAYAALRQQPGLTWYAPFDIWLAARHADVAAVLQDRRLLRTLAGISPPEVLAAAQRAGNWHDMPYHQRFVQFSLLDSDGAVHDRLRQVVFRVFTPVMVERLRAATQAFVEGCCDNIAGLGRIDFIEDFAALIPGQVIGRLLGVADADGRRLRLWSENIVQYFDIDRSDARKQLAERSCQEFYHFLEDLRQQRRRALGDDLLSQLILAEAAGQMAGDELISTCMLILMAGHGSSIDLLGSGLHALLRFPDQMRRLRQDPALIRSAVPEMLRFESPLPFFHRYCSEDVEIAGQTLSRGSKVGLLYGAANRDPLAFAQPDRFDIGRSPNRHLAFGGGAHFCLGNHLARLTLDIVFTTLLRRFADIALIAAPVYKTGLSVRGPRRLEIALTP